MKTRFSTSSFNIIKVVVTLLVLILFTAFLSRFYSSKNGAIHRQRFYEQKEDVDVLFMGTSHAYAGYLPMELYAKYGISAFNLATAGERFAVNYYSLLDAFEHHVPKVCVIDCHGFEYGDNKNDPQVPTRCHGVFDGMPLSEIKLRAITDVFSDDRSCWIEYLFPLHYFHNRWSELERQDFEDPVLNNYGKGGRFFYGIAGAEVQDFSVIPESEHSFADDLSTKYAEKIVEECEERGVDVYFMCIPFPCTEETQRILNSAYKIAGEHENCTYVNLMLHTQEMGFDYHIDMADPGSHVSLTGGQKVTDYIGKYLSDRYDFTDHRLEGEDSVWERDYRYYTTYLDGLRDKCENYFEYLALIYSPDYSKEIYISDMEKADRDGMLTRLIERDGETKLPEGLAGSYYCSDMGERFEESFGVAPDETHFSELAEPSEMADALVMIALRNNVTGELVEVSRWSETARIR